MRRTICTSVSLRASTRVSPGFTLLRYSSPSFGSQQVCSHSNLSPKIEVGCFYKRKLKLSLSLRTCPFKHVLAYVCGLLGPCFKTGHLKPFDTNAAGTLYLKAQRSPTSAHAQSVKRPRYTSRKCRVLENKIRNRPKPGKTPKRRSNLGR